MCNILLITFDLSTYYTSNMCKFCKFWLVNWFVFINNFRGTETQKGNFYEVNFYYVIKIRKVSVAKSYAGRNVKLFFGQCNKYMNWQSILWLVKWYRREREFVIKKQINVKSLSLKWLGLDLVPYSKPVKLIGPISVGLYLCFNCRYRLT